MVTIHGSYKGRLFLRENRKAKGLSAKVVGERMGMQRESVLRFERESVTRANDAKLANYANALGVTVRQLRQLPGAPLSLDEQLETVPEDKRELAHDMAVDILRRMGGKAG